MSRTFVLCLIGAIFCFTDADAVNDGGLSKPLVSRLMKVHLFNYTNWERVRDGLDEKLHVEEVGPFVYSQSLERVNITSEGDHVSFQEHSNFVYLPEKSVGTDLDQVVVPNVPLLTITALVSNMSYFLALSLNTLLQVINNPEPFVNLTVNSFLWGYEETLVQLGSSFLSSHNQSDSKFGLLMAKNGTATERLTINTGEHDIKKMNLIEKLNGKELLDYWGTPECNSIEGSDGSMFPPSLIDRNSPLMVFMPNLRRRLPFVYEKDVKSNDGTPLLRYRFPENVFDDNSQKQCYCETQSGTCPPQGIFNVTACSYDLPAYTPTLISFPHFHRADPKLREDVTGMKPDPVEHESYLDLDPTLGIVRKGKTAFQLNIQVRKPRGISYFDYLKEDLILPIAWIDMVVEPLEN